MHGLLIQQAVGPDHELLQLTRAHHRWYAWQHGLEYLCLEHNPAQPKRPGWGKIPLIMLAMQMGFQRIVWLDADAVIVDSRYDLSQLVDQGIGMVRHPNPEHWSTGVMVVAASQATFDFFQAVHAEPDNKSPWMERLAINTFAARPENAKLLTPLATAYNSVPGSVVAAAPVVLAAYGVAHEVKRELLLRWLRNAPVNEHGNGGIHPEVYCREDFGAYLNRRNLVGEAAEIGVQQGRFSRSFLDRWKGSLLHLIDPWRHFEAGYADIGNVADTEHEANMQDAVRILAPHNGRYRMHRKPSLEAVASFADNSLDFVYLDGNHDYKSVCDDIGAWFPKVRPGGVLAGHDYLDGQLSYGNFGVKSAVRAFECETGLVAQSTHDPPWASWYLTKPSA